MGVGGVQGKVGGGEELLEARISSINPRLPTTCRDTANQSLNLAFLDTGHAALTKLIWSILLKHQYIRRCRSVKTMQRTNNYACGVRRES